MRAKRTDANQQATMDALRDIGATVQDLHIVGDGCPDLLVGYQNITLLVETKVATGKVRDNQTAWHRLWRGSEVIVSYSPEDAVKKVRFAVWHL